MKLPAYLIESVSVVANKTLLQETQAIGFFSRHIADHYRKLGIVAVLPLEFSSLIGPGRHRVAQGPSRVGGHQAHD